MTYKYTTAVCVCILLLAACNTKKQAAVKEPYQAASFTDTAREEKILRNTPVIDSILMRYAKEEHLPGLAYGIVLDGKLIHSFYQGIANLNQNHPVDSLSVFRIASMSKSFTAMAILKLRDEGKIQLDDPASKYIPQMKGIKYLTADAPEITVRDLLSHKAGFPEDNPYGDRQLGDTQDQLMQLIKDNPSFSNVPGIKYEYSNLGFALLGTIISNVSGKSYQEYIKEQIFEPLGMKHTYWEYTKVPGNQLALGYRWINNGFEEQELEHDGSWGSMGGLLTTINDFSSYISYHLDAWPPRDDREIGPLKRSSRREMHMPWTYNSINLNFIYPGGKNCALFTNYGYGLAVVRDCQNRLSIGHGGGLPGFGSHWRIMPEYGLGIAIFSNRTYAALSPMTLQALDTLISLSGIQPYQLPASSILESRKKQLLSLLPDWKSAKQSEIFAENFFPDNPIDTLILHARTSFSKAGKIKSITSITPENNLRGFFDVIGENATIRISFTLSPEHDPKIQEYHLTELQTGMK